MKMGSMAKYAVVLAGAALFSVGSAQACMPGMAGMQGASSCTAAKGADKSCPTQGQQAGQAQSCLADRQEMMQAMGSMAMSGMEMATQMMRVMSEGLDSHNSTNPGI